MSEWFLIMLVPFAVVAFVLQERAFRMLRRRGGQRADGTWEKGRSPDDATAVGKAAMVGALSALTAVVAMRLTDRGEGWMWALAVAVLLVSVTVGAVSERRRIRREKVDVGYGPGRLKDDPPAP